MSAAADLSYELAQEYGVVVLADEGATLVAATAPHMTLATLAAARERLGKPLRTQAVSADEFVLSLRRAYIGASRSEKRVDPPVAIASSGTMQGATRDTVNVEDLLAQASASDAPAVRLLADLLREALASGASDIHIDATERGARIRFRIDGVLRDVSEIDGTMHAALIARCKVMATLDIAERRLPQDGRLQVMIAGRKVDVRVATLPTQHGERAVLRLLDTAAAALDFKALGMGEDIQHALRNAVRTPNGLVLVTGPTGSGKTTTLYAAVAELDRAKLNVVSVEDPIEYALDRVAQTQVNPRIELTFARALRSILRHDPDVIIVGEIRDKETAEIAIQASLTGHLVLASLHTNSAGSAIARLVDMGVEPYLLASCLRGVLAQRLVRRLCGKCRVSAAPNDAERALMQANGIANVSQLYAPRGCDACGDQGYRGRFGLYRWLPVDAEMSTAIHARASDATLESLATKAGFAPMAAGAGAPLREGATSLAEVLRVVSA
jgi:general secretion pathway protein E